MSSIASYVAITRVKSREGLLIYRPFDREPFSNGVDKGLQVLLQKMTGRDINWEALEAELLPKTRCGACKEMKRKTEYSAAEWRRIEKKDVSLCKACWMNCRDEEKNLKKAFCEGCQAEKIVELFSSKVLKTNAYRKKACTECEEGKEAEAQEVREAKEREKET